MNDQNKIKSKFEFLASKIKDVHGEHAISGILFGISSIFQDIIREKKGFFPILFLYGPGSSGKSELSETIQLFFGYKENPINLQGYLSDIKKEIIQQSKVKNSICQLSEYKNGVIELNGVLKALWDRPVFKRAVIDSNVGTEEIPINSSFIIDSNQIPNDETLLNRTIFNEMKRTNYSQKERDAFQELLYIKKHDSTNYRILFEIYYRHLRDFFILNENYYRLAFTKNIPKCPSRVIANYCVLAATYESFKQHLCFPFTQEEMIEHFSNCIKNQISNR